MRSTWLVRAILLSLWIALQPSSLYVLDAPLWPQVWTQTPHEATTGCASFTGYPVSCDELERVRQFNRDVVPTMVSQGVASVRKAMNSRGLNGHVWHVGHACPDPSKSSSRNDEDHGCNLFAQHAVDNFKLGHCLVSCAELDPGSWGRTRFAVEFGQV